MSFSLRNQVHEGFAASVEVQIVILASRFLLPQRLLGAHDKLCHHKNEAVLVNHASQFRCGVTERVWFYALPLPGRPAPISTETR